MYRTHLREQMTGTTRATFRARLAHSRGGVGRRTQRVVAPHRRARRLGEMGGGEKTRDEQWISFKGKTRRSIKKELSYVAPASPTMRAASDVDGTSSRFDDNDVDVDDLLERGARRRAAADSRDDDDDDDDTSSSASSHLTRGGEEDDDDADARSPPSSPRASRPPGPLPRFVRDAETGDIVRVNLRLNVKGDVCHECVGCFTTVGLDPIDDETRAVMTRAGFTASEIEEHLERPLRKVFDTGCLAARYGACCSSKQVRDDSRPRPVRRRTSSSLEGFLLPSFTLIRSLALVARVRRRPTRLPVTAHSSFLPPSLPPSNFSLRQRAGCGPCYAFFPLYLTMVMVPPLQALARCAMREIDADLRAWQTRANAALLHRGFAVKTLGVRAADADGPFGLEEESYVAVALTREEGKRLGRTPHVALTREDDGPCYGPKWSEYCLLL